METKNNKGFTLLELLISIAVASIVLSMLMQILVMSVQARNFTYINSTLQTESYLLAEEIKRLSFDHETQYVKINETASDITITFVHKWDIEIDSGTNAIAWVEVPEVEQDMVLVFDKNNHNFTMDGVALHSPNIYYEYTLDQYTTMSVDSIEGAAVCDPTSTALDFDGCENVVLTLTLYISMYENGALVDVQRFETTIIV